MIAEFVACGLYSLYYTKHIACMRHTVKKTYDGHAADFLYLYDTNLYVNGRIDLLFTISVRYGSIFDRKVFDALIERKIFQLMRFMVAYCIVQYPTEPYRTVQCPFFLIDSF